MLLRRRWLFRGGIKAAARSAGRIDSFIKKEEARRPTLSLYFGGSPAEGLTARLKGNLHGREELYYAVYWLHQTTEIPSGENKGKTLESSNIVKEVGQRAATRRQLSVPPFNPEEEGLRRLGATGAYRCGSRRGALSEQLI